jgi:prophage regulatory protein
MKDRFIRMKELITTTGLSRSSIYNRLDEKSKYADPSFPKPIRIGQGECGIVAWSEKEVTVWMDSKMQAR